MKATVKEAARERDFGTVVSKGAVRAMAVGMAVFVVGKFLPKTIGNMHSDIALTTAGLALAGVALTGSVVDDVVEDLKLSWTFVQNRKKYGEDKARDIDKTLREKYDEMRNNVLYNPKA